MTVIQKLKIAGKPLISVEFFPPKTGAAQDIFNKGAVELTGLKPDFVSVTCGAGGSAAGPTLEISKQLRGLGYDSVMPHCTCVGMSRDELARSTDQIVAQGFRDIWFSPRAGFFKNKRYAPAECGGCESFTACQAACPLYWRSVGTSEIRNPRAGLTEAAREAAHQAAP